MALGPKPGLRQSHLSFRPENSDFDHLDITLSSSVCLRGENSTYCGLTWYRPRVNPRGKEFGNRKIFHAKIEQNVIFSRAKKNPCAPTCPQLLMVFPINISQNLKQSPKFGMYFLFKRRNRDFKFWTLKLL